MEICRGSKGVGLWVIGRHINPGDGKSLIMKETLSLQCFFLAKLGSFLTGMLMIASPVLVTLPMDYTYKELGCII